MSQAHQRKSRTEKKKRGEKGTEMKIRYLLTVIGALIFSGAVIVNAGGTNLIAPTHN